MNGDRIHVLPELLANKIAAGEVVQRPASVVKELVENSLDAGATEVTIAVEDGGRASIVVADNGSGMGERDAMLALERHATSKIGSVDDLTAIATYGFRGEALPSIASVSRLSMKTRRIEDDVAVVVTCEGGGQRRQSFEGREPGTLITVNNLFFNIPARRKFLRSRSTEFRHVYDAVQRLSLGRPDVSFRLVSDGKIILDLRPAALRERMLDLFGDHDVAGMIPVQENSEVVGVEGFISKPAFGRRLRSQQFLFLNRRYVVSRNLNHAVFSAYEHLLLKSTYPFFLLRLSIDPSRVDVNVHPAKLEVKFEDESAIYGFIRTLVRKSLSGADHVPALSIGQGDPASESGLRFTSRQHSWGTRGGTPAGLPGKEAAGLLLATWPEPGDPGTPGIPGLVSKPVAAFEELMLEDADTIESGPVWQVHRRYILLQIRGGLMLVDQHVAHERVLYEQIVESFSEGRQAGQQLLFPQTFRLNPADAILLTEMLADLDQIGFLVRPFGGDTFVVESAPPGVKEGSEAEVVKEMVAQCHVSVTPRLPDSRDALAKSFSCKAAIKSGDLLSDEEMRSLVRKLFATKVPFVCPHGRPTVMRISLEELDRRFGRI
jgi:DNA mismatch repair protein MutL